MRTWALAAIGVAALLAGLYAVWNLRSAAPDATQPSSVDSRASIVTPGRTRRGPTDDRDSSRAAGPGRPRIAPGVKDEPPPLELGDSQDPQREENARAVYRSAVRELERLPSDDLPRAQAAFMRGIAALERVEDELAKDDEPGHVKLQADLDSLRAMMLRFAAAQ